MRRAASGISSAAPVRPVMSRAARRRRVSGAGISDHSALWRGWGKKRWGGWGGAGAGSDVRGGCGVPGASGGAAGVWGGGDRILLEHDGGAEHGAAGAGLAGEGQPG